MNAERVPARACREADCGGVLSSRHRLQGDDGVGKGCCGGIEQAARLFAAHKRSDAYTIVGGLPRNGNREFVAPGQRIGALGNRQTTPPGLHIARRAACGRPSVCRCHLHMVELLDALAVAPPQRIAR